MAVASMSKIYIYALKRDRRKILGLLQTSGVVEVEDLPLEYDLTKKDTTKETAVFKKATETFYQALDILEEHLPQAREKFKSLRGKKRVSAKEYNLYINERDEVLRVAQRIVSLNKHISQSQAEHAGLVSQLEVLSPWVNLDVPMRFKGTKTTKAFIGRVPGQWSEETLLREITEALQQKNNIEIKIITSCHEQTCIFLLCKNIDAEEIEAFLHSIDFALPALACKEVPALRSEYLQNKMKEALAKIKEAQEEIKSYVGQRNAFKFMLDYYTSRAEKYNIISRLACTDAVFILGGYMPTESFLNLKQQLTERFSAEVTLEANDEDAPVLLKNNAFAEPIETITRSYSMPGKGEPDPTPVMAVFYYILFGLMLSDAIYGLLVAGACGFLVMRFKDMPLNLKKSFKMFGFCGISTMFWGIMFGSYLGDAPSVIAKTFFGVEFNIPPLWFTPDKDPMRMLAFSFTVGVIHIFTGLGIKFFQLIKKRNYMAAFCDVGCWYLLVGGALFYLLSSPMFANMMQLNFVLPGQIGNVSAVCALIGASGILITAGRESKSIFKRLLKGLYALYNITGYLSDILSYSRLLALGLATAVMANVFNKIAAMMATSGGIIGSVLFILVFVAGHTLNISINMLGSYVHTSRLQFVEFFGKFYEGGGREFAPFCTSTEYYDIKIEE